MIRIIESAGSACEVIFMEQKKGSSITLPAYLNSYFQGAYLESYLDINEHSQTLYIGAGDIDHLESFQRKELFAKMVKELKKVQITECAVNMRPLIKKYQVAVIADCVEGTLLGLARQLLFRDKSNAGKESVKETEMQVGLFGIPEVEKEAVNRQIQKSTNLAEGILFARDMVNMPGNMLRPADFAEQIKSLFEGTKAEVSCMDYDTLCEIGMQGLVSVGKSSKYKPCMVMIRYRGSESEEKITGMVGKGVTCDTGGYCLKPAASMTGIKGDMAGGAAVAGAIYGLVKNEVRTNVTGIIPICENRISDDSMLPGDVIDSYSGKKIEVLNTDAEGRLILADAVSYAVQNEQVTEIVDIATLTGAVVNLLGFSIAGVLSDDEQLYRKFEKAYEISSERYLRIPFYKEHEKMIESNIADIKNLGEKYCGTITAGLFIRAFARSLPWLHMDIAGTAWVDKPVFEYQNTGATGAGVTTLYHLCTVENK